MHPLRIGLKLPQQFTTVAELRSIWRIADEAGFDHCWVFDHLASLGSDTSGPVFEAWSLVAAMAEATTRTRVGVMVTGNGYRHPGVLAKMAVTVDFLSSGRLEMGIGAGWVEREHTMFGLPFGTPGERIDRLAEAIRVMKLLWTADQPDFHGGHYSLVNALASPKPIQKPHPPIWIGGKGERKTLRVVAELADVWNVSTADPDECARLSNVLDRHCREVGRREDDVRRSVELRFDGSREQALRAAEAYIDRGFTELVISVSGTAAVKNAEIAAAQLLPSIKELAREVG